MVAAVPAPRAPHHPDLNNHAHQMRAKLDGLLLSRVLPESARTEMARHRTRMILASERAFCSMLCCGQEPPLWDDIENAARFALQFEG